LSKSGETDKISLYQTLSAFCSYNRWPRTASSKTEKKGPRSHNSDSEIVIKSPARERKNEHPCADDVRPELGKVLQELKML
jgi:hypothetical protein